MSDSYDSNPLLPDIPDRNDAPKSTESTPNREYTPEQALGVLLRKLGERDERLAQRVEELINAGKEISVTEPRRASSKKGRRYTKAEPYSYEEALNVAVAALEAYFIHQPLFMNSVIQNFRETAVNQERGRFSYAEDAVRPEMGTLGRDKELVIELQTETRISKDGDELYPIVEILPEAIAEQRHNLIKVRDLLTFKFTAR